MRKGFALLVLLFSTAMPAVKAYDVDVYRNNLATVPGDQLHGVGEYLRMCVDSLTRASLWVADADTHSFHARRPAPAV